MTCDRCSAPLLRAGFGVVVHVTHAGRDERLCKACGGWDEPRVKPERGRR